MLDKLKFRVIINLRMIPKKRGEEVTKQKLLIKSIIESHEGHLTAEEIFILAKEKMPNIALGTVYRNLGKLCEANEIGLISVSGRPDRYDKSLNTHGHTICDICGKITDFPAPVSEFKEQLEKHLGIDITAYDVSAHYVCEDCKQ